MVEILTVAQAKKKARGGRPNKLEHSRNVTNDDGIFERISEPYAHIGMSYGVLAKVIHIMQYVGLEDTLIKADEFKLPGKKELLKTDNEFEVILLDATESPIERPKKKQNVNSIPAKKKRHTLKTLVVVDKKKNG